MVPGSSGVSQRFLCCGHGKLELACNQGTVRRNRFSESESLAVRLEGLFQSCAQGASNGVWAVDWVARGREFGGFEEGWFGWREHPRGVNERPCGRMATSTALLLGLVASPMKSPWCPGARVVRIRSPKLCDAAELRAARAAASDAANAEARLRSMVAAANRNADALAAERDRALEDLRDLRGEAEAAATLAAQDIAGLEQTVADLLAQLAAARSGEGTSASPEAAEALRAAAERASALEDQLASSRRETAFALDEVAELRARCSLAEAEADAMAELSQEADELREAVRRAEARLAAGVSGVAPDARIATLEAQ
eukprot:scaffold18498_cov89-Isochrysis_galbana.AAC.2